VVDCSEKEAQIAHVSDRRSEFRNRGETRIYRC